MESVKKDLSQDALFDFLPEAEKTADIKLLKTQTVLRRAGKRFMQNKLAMLGLIFIGLIILMAIFVPAFSEFQYNTQDLSNRNALPSWTHPFGTDKLGRDILVRVMVGARVSLLIGFSAAFFNLVIGVIYGGISGLKGGWVDNVMMRIVDIIYSVPSYLYVILILVTLGNGFKSMLIAITLTSWVGMARQVRAQVLALKEREYVLASKTLGAGQARILFKDVVLNSLGPIIIVMVTSIPKAILTESFFSFVGIGITPPNASWGVLANEAREVITSYPIHVIWPMLALSLTVLSFNFIGDGLTEAFE
ncbi:MAG: ABC transporter permease [Lachnospiraceae bacterium]|nr:ABC transporter permease [Lachnospiraceae bacterium]